MSPTLLTVGLTNGSGAMLAQIDVVGLLLITLRFQGDEESLFIARRNRWKKPLACFQAALVGPKENPEHKRSVVY